MPTARTFTINTETYHDRSGRFATVIRDDDAGGYITTAIDEATVLSLRDALTAWLDAPRLAARKTPDVARRDGNDVLTWFTGPNAEHDARTLYASERGKALCVCGAECDEDEIDRSDDEPMCPACVKAAIEHWRAADVVCMAGIFVPEAHAFAPGGCGWRGKGADAHVSDGEPTCPKCGGGVEEIETTQPEATK